MRKITNVLKSILGAIGEFLDGVHQARDNRFARSTSHEYYVRHGILS